MPRESELSSHQRLARAMELLQQRLAALPEQERQSLEQEVAAVGAAAEALVGQASAQFTHHEDLTEERDQLLAQLSVERGWLDAIVQQMPLGISIAEAPSGRLVRHNDAAVELLGHPMLPTNDYLGYAQYNAFHKDGTRYRAEDYPLVRALFGEVVVREEMLYQRGDGTTTCFLMHAKPVYEQNGLIIAAVTTFQDISEQKRVEAERAALYESERQARERAEDAIRVRESFLAIGAHELRTPVAAIHGFAQLLERRLRTRDTVEERDRRALATIKGQAEHTNHLIEALLDVARLREGGYSLTRVPLDLCALTQRVVDDLEPLFEQHDIDYECGEQALFVAGDALRLEQVLQNLLQNAVKYSPAGGRVRVRVEVEANGIAWMISDQGIGVPSSARGQLFERFYRADNALSLPVGGLGIGLHIVQELVQLHGGTVEVRSQRGQGTTFTVHLPRLER